MFRSAATHLINCCQKKVRKPEFIKALELNRMLETFPQESRDNLAQKSILQIL